jgi:hopene-associated glycosyltransferase HpnB
MRSPWEKLLVPAFVYFFKLLYPFRISNSNHQLVAAAAGGCILVDSSMLVKIGGFGAVRGELIDDCALARQVKRAGARTWIGLTHDATSGRPMDTLSNIWRMVARSAYAQLRYSPRLLVGCVAALVIAFWIPLVALDAGPPSARLLASVALLAMIGTYLPTLHYYGRSPGWALLLPVIGTIYLLMTISSAWHHWRGRGAVWKGRRYVH